MNTMDFTIEFPSRSVSRELGQEEWPRKNLAHLIVVILGSMVLCGCSADDAPEPMTAEAIQDRVLELEQSVSELSGRAADGALHALSSPDPAMRAQAALAFAKTGHGTAVVFERLEQLALHDEDPLVRAAGLTAICRIGRSSDRTRSILKRLASDPQLVHVARSLESLVESR